VFEKEVVLCGKQKTSKTGSKCENVTQVVWRVTSYDDEERKKKVLALAQVWPAVSIGKCQRNAADFCQSDFSNGGATRARI